jgi:hypothetical protein
MEICLGRIPRHSRRQKVRGTGGRENGEKERANEKELEKTVSKKA